jgi:hypothetical protein
MGPLVIPKEVKLDSSLPTEKYVQMPTSKEGLQAVIDSSPLLKKVQKSHIILIFLIGFPLCLILLLGRRS